MKDIHIVKRYKMLNKVLNVYIAFDYDENLVNDVKRLPRKVRRWIAADKQWCIEEPYASTWLKEQAAKGFRIIDHVTPSAELSAGLTKYSIGKYVDSLPQEHLARVYKVLAFAFHPDQGGDTRRFQDLQTNYLAIRKQKEFEK